MGIITEAWESSIADMGAVLILQKQQSVHTHDETRRSKIP